MSVIAREKAKFLSRESKIPGISYLLEKLCGPPPILASRWKPLGTRSNHESKGALSRFHGKDLSHDLLPSSA
jgi:hypothetical protein